jgi:hypothetical protein
VSASKQEVVSFKVDRSMLEALKGIPNRSEFIRNALMAALDSVCPLCHGTGILTPNQKQHWEAFARGHQFAECPDCQELHLVCVHEDHNGDEHESEEHPSQ